MVSQGIAGKNPRTDPASRIIPTKYNGERLIFLILNDHLYHIIRTEKLLSRRS